jgi:hypothetical protein
MPTYRVFVEGTNILMRHEDQREPQRFGFYVTRFVDAADSERAAEQALALVRNEPKLIMTALNSPYDPPAFRVEEVECLSPDEDAPSTPPGFAFFPVTPDE